MHGAAIRPKDSLQNIVHRNAIEGCQSWDRWKEITFETTPDLTWYRCTVPDILLNSVLDANYDLPGFNSVVRRVTEYCTTKNSPIAWLVADPSVLTSNHREIFLQSGFHECPGTTGMYLDLKDPSLSELLDPSIPPSGGGTFSCRTLSSDEELLTWSKLLIEIYNFPRSISGAWQELHSSIGHIGAKTPQQKTRHGWQHFLIYDEERDVGDQTIGTASIFLGKTPDSSTFANLSISPEYRGRGLGSFVVRQTLAELQKESYEAVTLYASGEAVGLYSRLGFTSTGKNTFFVREVSNSA